MTAVQPSGRRHAGGGDRRHEAEQVRGGHEGHARRVQIAAVGVLGCLAVRRRAGRRRRSPATAHAAAAKPSPAYPKGHYTSLNSLPDWGGVWVFSRPAPGRRHPERPALKGQYLKDYEAWREAVKTNGWRGRPTRAPTARLPGMPGIMGVGQYPMEFLFTPGRVTTHHEAWMQWRNIYTDGRGHPDDLEATFEGDSIGHWEGGTLVVDTIGIKEAAPLGQGMKHGPKMHIRERIHLAPKRSRYPGG